MTTTQTVAATDVTCPYCGAPPRRSCLTPSGYWTKPHTTRREFALRSQAGRFEIRVNGIAYDTACDPAVTNVPVVEGWPDARPARWGYGRSFIYEVTREEAWRIAYHLAAVGATLLDGGVDDRALGRSCVRAADSIRESVRRWDSPAERGEQ